MNARIQPELFAQNAGRSMPMRISNTTSSLAYETGRDSAYTADAILTTLGNGAI